mgnify:CR=1 FL=1
MNFLKDITEDMTDFKTLKAIEKVVKAWETCGQGLVKKLAVAMWKPIVQTIPNYLDSHKSYINWFNTTIVEKS